MAPFHMATLTVHLNMRLSLPYLRTKNKTMAPFHMATLTVQRELLASRVSTLLMHQE